MQYFITVAKFHLSMSDVFEQLRVKGFKDLKDLKVKYLKPENFEREKIRKYKCNSRYSSKENQWRWQLIEVVVKVLSQKRIAD